MSVQIEIPELLFKRIQNHARPFVDTTPVSVLERWADWADMQMSVSIESNAISLPRTDGNGARQWDPSEPPNLLHTKVYGEIGGTHFQKWQDLLIIALKKGFSTTGSFEELRKITRANIVNGSFSENGYKFLPDVGFSVQGVDANHAWQHAFGLAQALKFPIKAHIEWRNKDKALYPGESGVLAWTP